MTKRQPVTPQDWMVDLERRIKGLERRTGAPTAADILGPGLSTQATLVTDWNGEEMDFNGIFYSRPGARHAPDVYSGGSLTSWIGWNLVDSEGNGYQRISEYVYPDVATLVAASPPRAYSRAFTPQSGIRRYSTWMTDNWIVESRSTSNTTINSTTAVEVDNLFIQTTVRDPAAVFLVSAGVDVNHTAVTNASPAAFDLRQDGIGIGTGAFHAQGINGLRTMLSWSRVVTGLAGTVQFNVTGRVFTTPESYQANANNSYISLMRVS